MIKTRQKLVITRIFNSINKNWGVAVGFLMLLFLIPILIVVTYTPGVKNITKNNADSSTPLVHISPDHGQGTNQLFVVDVSTSNVDSLQNLDVWFGQQPYSQNNVSGDYATVSFENFGINDNKFDWRSVVYTIKNDGTHNILTSLLPDDSSSLNLSTVYSIPTSNKGEVNLSAKAVDTAHASIKFIKVEKKSSSLLQFYIKTNFTDNFNPSTINIYNKVRNSLQSGNALSSDWNKIGIWNAALPIAKPFTITPPKFTSIPSSKAQVGSLYKYMVTATDAQNYPLTFSVVTSPLPKFLSFDGSILSGTPTIDDIGSHTIVISVNDPYGNIVTQSWSINITSANNINPTPSVTVSFNSPSSNSVFTGVSNDITWSLASPIGIANIKLSYSLQTGNNFHEIKTISSTNVKYTWDVSNISDGQYIIKLEPLDSSGNVINPSMSSVFTIKNEPTNVNIKAPTLNALTPQDSETITDHRPTISANFKQGSSELDFNTLKFSLDNTVIPANDPNFTLATLSFTYRPALDLSIGQHVLNVFVKGKDAKSDQDGLNKSWTFIINEQLPGTTNSQSTVVEKGISLPLVGRVPTWLGTLIIAVFVILLFGILIFAIIMLIRILKKNDDETTQITKYYQHDQPTQALETNNIESPTNIEINPSTEQFEGRQYTLDSTESNNLPNSILFPESSLNQPSSSSVDLSPFKSNQSDSTTTLQSDHLYAEPNNQLPQDFKTQTEVASQILNPSPNQNINNKDSSAEEPYDPFK